MPVQIGLDVLLTDALDLVRGRRVGLLAHPASVDARMIHAVELLRERPDVRLTALFGPQHGVRGETQANMIEWRSFRDPRTGLPVYSLYGDTRKPTEAMLQEIDLLVIDLQDVGSRYYTYIYTMALAMEACREQGKQVLVLDRPNPLNGLDLEGPLLDPAFKSFVGLFPLPVRHAMTIAELARLFNTEFGIRCDLEVVPMRGWRREMFFDQTGLAWVPPSPNMPRPETALVYPGLCLLEGTNVSEGRGTTLPFELSGAPWVDPDELAAGLTNLLSPGAHFRPVRFVPTFDKWTGHPIGGVQIHVGDRRAFRPFRTGLELMRAYRSQGGRLFAWKSPPYEYEFELLPIDILCGTDTVRRTLETGGDLEPLERRWEVELDRFRRLRERSLLY